MSDSELLKLSEKLEALESRLESQESELAKIIYSKTFSILNQTDADQVADNVERRTSIHKTKEAQKSRLHIALKKHILEWMLVSTWSGPGIIIRVKNILRKIYWTIIFLLCMAATIYVMVETVNAYMKYGEVTSISATSDGVTDFPTVKIIYFLIGIF